MSVRADKALLIKDDRKRTAEAAEALIGAFEWSASPQGYEYWSEIFSNLCALAGPEYPALLKTPRRGAT